MLVDDNARGDGEAYFRGKLDIRQNTDADDDKIGRDMPAVAETDAGNLSVRALDAGRLHAKVDADAGRGVSRLKIIRDLRGDGARHHPRAEFDHVDLKTLGAGGRGKFEADESGADHRDVSRDADPLAQRLALVEDAQVFDIGEVGVRQVEQAIARAGREHQMAIIKKAPRGEQQPVGGAIDKGGAVADQFDVLVAIEFVGTEHQAVWTPPAPQIRLGQRRPLIGQMRLVVDQADAFAKPMLAQGDGNLETGGGGGDDQNGFLFNKI